MRDHTQMLSGFRYGRTQHVRAMRSNVASVVYYVSTRLFYASCDARQRHLSPFSAKVKRIF